MPNQHAFHPQSPQHLLCILLSSFPFFFFFISGFIAFENLLVFDGISIATQSPFSPSKKSNDERSCAISKYPTHSTLRHLHYLFLPSPVPHSPTPSTAECTTSSSSSIPLHCLIRWWLAHLLQSGRNKTGQLFQFLLTHSHFHPK